MSRHATVGTQDGAILPGLDDDRFDGMFDYAREDRFIAQRRSTGSSPPGQEFA